MIFQQEIEVISNRRTAGDVHLLAFSSDRLARAARPGQFLHLLPSRSSDPLLRRPFSLHDVVGSKLYILYRIAGRGTKLLSTIKAGQKLNIIGPLGRGFIINRNFTNHLLVAGGIGFAPIRFLYRELHDQKLSHAFFFGCRSKKEVLPLLPKRIILTSDDGSCGSRGFITSALEEKLSGYSNPVIYACGPWPMLQAVARICQARTIPFQVSLESFMACGVGACQGCAVKTVSGMATVCHDGPVFDGREIDWDQESLV